MLLDIAIIYDLENIKTIHRVTIIYMSIQLSVNDSLRNTTKEETCIPDFPLIQKLQN